MQFSVTKAKVQKVDGTNEIVTINNRNGNQEREQETEGRKEMDESGKKPYEAKRKRCALDEIVRRT